MLTFTLEAVQIKLSCYHKIISSNLDFSLQKGTSGINKDFYPKNKKSMAQFSQKSTFQTSN